MYSYKKCTYCTTKTNVCKNSKVLTPEIKCCKINIFRGVKTYIYYKRSSFYEIWIYSSKY